MNFEESVKYVESATRQSRERDDLSVIKELLIRLGSPQNDFKAIHVAGTNGKGSVCAFVESSLRLQGYKTGLFTSPYIQVFNERIQIGGTNVADKTFARVATLARQTAEDMQNEGYPPASFFELLTAIAFVIFKEESVEIAVIETGIGGTYDSTNVVEPVLSIITSIAYDHMNILGNSIDEIAQNKAGIIKNNCPVVIADQKYDEAYAILLSVAKEKNAPLFSLSKANIRIDAIGFDGAKFNFDYGAINADIKTKLVGYHQVQNAACAFLALCVLAQYTDIKLTPTSILNGIYSTQWICRLEVLSKEPLIIVDGAHNENAAASMVKSIEDFLPAGKANVVFGVMQRKNYIPMAKHIKEIAKQIYTVSIDAENSVDGAQLAAELQDEKLDAVNIGDIKTTITSLLEQKNTPIVICGSLYLAGKAREIIKRL